MPCFNKKAATIKVFASAFICFGAVFSTPFSADEPTDAMRSAQSNLFKITVERRILMPAGRNNSGLKVFKEKTVFERGTAFAIADDMLITTRSTIEPEKGALLLEVDNNLAASVIQTVGPARSKISLHSIEDFSTDTPSVVIGRKNAIPQTASWSGVDAARIFLGKPTKRDAKASQPFDLSMCALDQDAEYRVLIAKNEQASTKEAGSSDFEQETEAMAKEALKQPDFIRLVPVGYKMEQFHQFYVFNTVGENVPTDFDKSMAGYQGSPIMDEEGRVVGILSKVDGEGVNKQVLMTPISLFTELFSYNILSSKGLQTNCSVSNGLNSNLTNLDSDLKGLSTALQNSIIWDHIVSWDTGADNGIGTLELHPNIILETTDETPKIDILAIEKVEVRGVLYGKTIKGAFKGEAFRTNIDFVDAAKNKSRGYIGDNFLTAAKSAAEGAWKSDGAKFTKLELFVRPVVDGDILEVSPRSIQLRWIQ